MRGSIISCWKLCHLTCGGKEEEKGELNDRKIKLFYFPKRWRRQANERLFKKVTNSLNAFKPERFHLADGFKHIAPNYITPLISSNDFRFYIANTSWWIGIKLIQRYAVGGLCFLSSLAASIPHFVAHEKGKEWENELKWGMPGRWVGNVINFSTENNCMKLINAIIKNMLVCSDAKNGKDGSAAHRRNNYLELWVLMEILGEHQPQHYEAE